MKQNRSGPLFVLLSAMLMSLGGLLIKAIPWSAMAVNGGRNLFASVVTLTFMLVSGHKLRMNKTTVGCAAVICANYIIYTISVRLTTAANAIVIEYVSPVFVLLYMALLFGQKPKRSDLAACGVVFAGVCCFFLDGLSSGGMAGNLLALVAAATYAVVFLTKALPEADSLSSFFMAQLMCGIIGLPWIWAERGTGAGAWAAIVFMGVVQIGAAYIFMSLGLAHTSPVMANVICMVEPILNPIWTAVFYGERIGPLSMVGVVVVLGGLLVYYLRTGREA